MRYSLPRRPEHGDGQAWPERIRHSTDFIGMILLLLLLYLQAISFKVVGNIEGNKNIITAHYNLYSFRVDSQKDLSIGQHVVSFFNLDN